MGMVALTAPEVAAQDDPPPNQNAIYVFGDSFASGEGVDFYLPDSDTADNDCHKSLYSFGFRLFLSMNVNGTEGDFSNYPNRYFSACSGAKVADLLTNDQEGDGPQLAQVPPVADGAVGVAFSAVGVNDLGFTPVLTECFFVVSCHTNSTLSQIVNIDQNLDVLGGDLLQAYATIEGHAVGTGDMKVYVVGYPKLFSDSTDAFCGGALGFEPAERAWANEQARRLNERIFVVTLLLPDVEYIDIDPYFEGHRLCDPDPWVHGITLPIEHSFHPNRTGHYVVEQVSLQRMYADGLGGPGAF
jgi:hypothetical protein